MWSWVRAPREVVYFVDIGEKYIGDAGYRSLYLSHAERALYHLSYTPMLLMERWICASAAPPLPKITLWRPGRAQLLPTFQAKCNARTVGMSAPFLIRPDTNQVCKRGRNAKPSQPAVPYQCRPTMQFCRSSHCPLSGTGSSRVRGGWAPL